VTPHRAITTLLAAALATLLGAGLLAPATSLAAAAGPRPAAPAAERREPVIVRTVQFPLVNTNDSPVACFPDRRGYPVRARLVGPRSKVLGVGREGRINVLVHDAGTGSWFWNQSRTPAYDYAGQLGRRGELSLVVDRLGYDRSPLRDGTDTCLGAQVHMLHQLIQKLYAGNYRFTGNRRVDPPHAGRVVVHGHGTGATIAQLEAAQFDDTEGLVLMSWPGVSSSGAAVAQVRDQVGACLRGAGYAAFGRSPAAFRSLLFATAPAAVQRAATRQRNATPCGDVTSLASALLGSGSTAARVEVPVLVMYGSRDSRVRPGAAAAAGRMFRGSEAVTPVTVPGAGSALPLERSAPRTRSAVLSWLGRL